MTINLNDTKKIKFKDDLIAPTYSLEEFMMNVKPKLYPTKFSNDTFTVNKGIIIENDGVYSKIILPLKLQNPIVLVCNNEDYKIVK